MVSFELLGREKVAWSTHWLSRIHFHGKHTKLRSPSTKYGSCLILLACGRRWGYPKFDKFTCFVESENQSFLRRIAKKWIFRCVEAPKINAEKFTLLHRVSFGLISVHNGIVYFVGPSELTFLFILFFHAPILVIWESLNDWYFGFVILFDLQKKNVNFQIKFSKSIYVLGQKATDM